MADTSIASAVVLPEPQDQPDPQSPSLKRRTSSIEQSDTKRTRLEIAHSNASINNHSPQSPNQKPRNSALGIRGTGAAEERKRGQRLFGALLGTLSQSSTSAAQRRRADIERKQQDKLKEKDHELDEERRKKRENVLEKRRKEQVVWERESMQIQQENARAMSHFLKTEAKPHLYYKPWELLPEEESRLESQIRDAQNAIEGESDQAKGSEDKMDVEKVLAAVSDQLSPHDTELIEQPEMANGSTQEEEEEDMPPLRNPEQMQNGEPAPATNEDEPAKEDEVDKSVSKNEDEHKPSDDHGGEELLEGAEDDVIY